MLLSQWDCEPILQELMAYDQEVSQNTIRLIDRLVHDGLASSSAIGDVLFVFGSRKMYRYDKAAELWKDGCAGHILLTGGKATDQLRSEAEEGAAYLIEHGVDPACMIVETQSAYTVDNVQRSLPLLRERFGDRPLRIVLVTLSFHVRRCLLIARMHFPEAYSFVAIPAYDTNTRPDNWHQTSAGREHMARELRSLSAHARNGWSADCEMA